MNEAWKSIHNKFKKIDVSLETYVLHNELSKDFIEAFELELDQYQLVTPCKYKKNQAERAIRTFKSHFKYD